MSSAIALHAVLHLTGGKVAGTVMWRKNLDLAASDAHSALDELVSHSSECMVSDAENEVDNGSSFRRNISLTETRCAIVPERPISDDMSRSR
jgi:hypothetical protein